MPKIRTRQSRPPAGFEALEPTLLELERRMREVESAPHEGKRKHESVWPIFRIQHQRSRYVFEQFYTHKAISRDVYDYCVREGHADAALIAKWRKDGYERLCCLQCVSTRDHSFGTVCICRVPRAALDAGKVFECPHCGCRGCSSGDANAEAMLSGAAFMAGQGVGGAAEAEAVGVSARDV